MALTKVTGSVIKDSVSLSGNVSVGGTLTYQDVTNVDALGIGTFRTGIKVLAGQVDVGSNIKLGNAGVVTATSFSGALSGTTGSFSGQVNVGSNIKLGTAGVITATSFVGSFVGSGANLTGIALTSLNVNGNTNNNLITATGNQYTVQGESDLTWDGNSLGLTAGTGNQFPIQIRNDFTPNSQRSDYASLLNATSNNTLRLGSINSNGGATIQVTRGNDSAVKHNLSLQPDGGYVWINKATSSDYGRFEVKGPTADDIDTSTDIRTKTVATFSGSTPGTTAAGKGMGIVIKPISDRGSHYFFGAANDSANQEAHGRFIIRSGHLASASAERLRINSSGNVELSQTLLPLTDNTPSIGNGTKNFNSIWASNRFRGNDNVKLILGNSQDLVIYHASAVNYINSPQGGSLHIKSGTGDNANLKHIQCDYNGGTIIYHQNGGSEAARISTTNDGITFGGEVNFNSGYNVRTFAGAVYLTDGQHADIVAHNSGYAWGFFEFYGISYHGSIGRCRWHGSMSRYGGEDNYPTINNSMSYWSMQRATDGSNANIRYIRLQRTGTYGGVWCNYYVRCYAANSTSSWTASHASTTQKYSGN